MSLAIVYSRALCGIDSCLIRVEVHLSSGLPAFIIVGLPEAVVRESRERVRSAIYNSRFDFPMRRITVNLAPAELPKSGGCFDLPIALGVLAASKQISKDALLPYEFAGELALTGELRPFKGVLPFAVSAKKGNRSLILPLANAKQINMIKGVIAYPAQHLLDVCAHLNEKNKLKKIATSTMPHVCQYEDMYDVKSQDQAKRALEIAAAGKHHLLLIGPPGVGKTMLSIRLPGIMMPLSEKEALTVAMIHSISTSGFNMQEWQRRPFRSPHHTASAIALAGGGRPPKPGEVSLAHHGVLFLDELPEFNRSVLESLREPLESGYIIISRASHQIKYPASFQLIAAMNPCPCGYFSDNSNRCFCGMKQIERYHQKISGPLLDRIDMQVNIPSLPQKFFINHSSKTEASNAIRCRVEAAYKIQEARQKKINAMLSCQEIKRYCDLTHKNIHFLDTAALKLKLSARGLNSVLKVARTIADLSGMSQIQRFHLEEAMGYRNIIFTKRNY
jgi:magnesium chelatase family protein